MQTPLETQIIYSIICISLIILIVVGNFLVILVYFVDRRLRNPTNALIVSLSFADLIVGVVGIPIDYTYLFYGEWNWGEILCYFWNVNNFGCSIASSNLLVLIALDRFRIVHEGIPYIQQRTMKSVVYIPVLVVWLLATWCIAPLIIKPSEVIEYNVEEKSCRSLRNTNFYFFTNMGMIVFPAITMLYLYVGVFQGLKLRWQGNTNRFDQTTSDIQTEENSLNNISTLTEQKVPVKCLLVPSGTRDLILNVDKHKPKPEINERKERKAATTLGFLVAIFFLCWVPYLIVSTLSALEINTGSLHVSTVAALVGHLNSGLNPIVYAIRNEDFVSAVKLTWRKIKRGCRNFIC